MMRAATVGFAMTLVVVVGAAPSAAQPGPAFDCAKASGEVETLICKDPALAGLDRKLDQVYKAALAKARDAMPARVRTEQRGWISGRNECWKSKDADNGAFLTESWRASSVRECVEGQYQMRISELQAVWQLLPAKGPTSFACQNNPANEIVATFFDTEPPTARLERGDRAVTAWAVRAASGSKYEGQNVSFWLKGSEATVRWLNPATGVNDEITCRVR